MKKIHLKLDDSLLISQIQQQELMDIEHVKNFDAKFFSNIVTLSLVPFLNNVPFNIGLKLHVIGSEIINAQIERHYFRNGICDDMAQHSPHDAIMAISRLKIASPIFYQIALMTAFEQLTNKKDQAYIDRHYAIAMEFGRVTHHLHALRNILLCLNLASSKALVQNLCDVLKRPIDNFCRVYSEADAPKSIAQDIDIIWDLSECLSIIDELMSTIGQEDKIVLALSQKAVINLSNATSLGLTGPYLRANRSYYDARSDNWCRNRYEIVPIITVTDGGDAWARFSLRLLETRASLKWLKQALFNAFEQGQDYLKPITVARNFCQIVPQRPFAFGEIEGPEGNIRLSIFTRPDNSLIFRVRSAAFFVAQSMPHLLSGLKLREIPLILHSLGITAEEIDL